MINHENDKDVEIRSAEQEVVQANERFSHALDHLRESIDGKMTQLGALIDVARRPVQFAQQRPVTAFSIVLMGGMIGTALIKRRSLLRREAVLENPPMIASEGGPLAPTGTF